VSRSEAARLRALGWLAARGGRTRQLASRVDLAAAMGLRHSRAALLDRRRLNEFGGGARDALYRYIWGDAAAELGAEVIELSHDILELRRGRSATRVWRQITMYDDAVTLHMSLDKPLMHRRLRELGLPVPDHLVYGPGELGPALEFLASASGQPVVVKPAAGTGGGEGVTTGVRSPEELARATLRAARFSGDVLIERQPAGSVLRALFFGGELLDTVSQGPPRLSGDGRSTIVELIAAENERRLSAEGRRGPSPLRIDLDCVLHLRHAGRRLDDVPEAGEVFTVKGVTNENGVGDSTRVTDLSPGLVDQCRRAHRAVGLELVGIDLIAADPAGDEQGTILEVNGGPGLHHHYLVADGEPARVAVPILDALLS
jgi:D-alanine-D-alanine ligase-like ATP-grasp enzyme